MARPRTLTDDLTLVKAAGIDTVVSLLEPAEAASLGLAAQQEACAALDLTFLNHPIRDMHLPAPAAFAGFAADVAARLRSGAHVAVHCRASIGRSGMLVCTVLGHFGYDSAAALSHVSKMRGEAVPDTHEQTDFIKAIMTIGKA